MGLGRNPLLTQHSSMLKAAQRPSNPSLYKEFALDSWEDGVLLLKTLLSNPQLGKFCRSITFSSWDDEAADDHPISPEDLLLFKERIELYCNTPDEVEKWVVRLKNRECEATIGLLLSCIPNVEKLNFNEYKEASSDSINRVFDHAAMLQSQGSDSPFSLSKLASVSGEFNVWAGLSWLLPPLRLKSVKTAHFDRVFDDIKQRAETPTIEMEALVLGVVVDGEWSQLENFLSDFKTIKTLRLSEDDFERDPCYESEPNTLDYAISGLKHCLEELEIDQFRRHPEDEPWLSSLVDFQKLRKISLDGYTLFKPTHMPRQRDNDWLPPSLEELELVNYDHYALDQLVRILQSRQEAVPKLFHITFKRRIVDVKNGTRVAMFKEAVWDLEKECRNAGIALEFWEERVVRAVNNRSTEWTRIEFDEVMD